MKYRPGDIGCRQALEADIITLEKTLEIIDDFSVCVQAGANVGVWPKRLSEKFRDVYCFEPDPENFLFLTENVRERNVFKYPAALGLDRGCVRVEMDHPDNTGAYSVQGKGNIPVLRIDDLGLPSCGFIALDIEGFEMGALLGAENTIRQFSPVVLFEEKGLGERYGWPDGECGKFLERFGYEVVLLSRRDVIMKRRN